MAFARRGASPPSCWPPAAALALLTDVDPRPQPFSPTGAEAATSLLAVAYLVASASILCDHFHLRGATAQRLCFAWAAAVLALAAWRWGFRVYAGAAAGALLLLAANFPAPRLAWLAAAASMAAGAGSLLARRDFTPSHRGGIALARAVALAAVFLAVNYLSVRQGLHRGDRPRSAQPHHRAGEIALVLAWAGSALYPPLSRRLGRAHARPRAHRPRDRDRGLSLATLRFYVQIAPLWAVLAAAGAALAGASLLLERWLRSGAGGERAGFTAAPLYDESRRERLLPVAAALASAPEARALPQEPRGSAGRGRGLRRRRRRRHLLVISVRR